MSLENTCDWAVVATCEVKNNGVKETFKKIIATFNYPFLAQDYIDKCLPVENKHRFEVKAIKDIVNPKNTHESICYKCHSVIENDNFCAICGACIS